MACLLQPPSQTTGYQVLFVARPRIETTFSLTNPAQPILLRKMPAGSSPWGHHISVHPARNLSAFSGKKDIHYRQNAKCEPFVLALAPPGSMLRSTLESSDRRAPDPLRQSGHAPGTRRPGSSA